MRAALAFLLIVTEPGCALEKPGLDLHMSVPLGIAKVVLFVEDNGDRLTMAPPMSGRGVAIQSEPGKVSLTFDSLFPGLTSGAFDVLLQPSSGGLPFQVGLSGLLLESDGRTIGTATPVAGVRMAPGKRTNATLAFTCFDSTTCKPSMVTTVDLVHDTAPTPGIKQYQGDAGDYLRPLAIGQFVKGGSRGDLVVGAPSKSATVGMARHPGSGIVYVFFGQDWVTGFLGTPYNASNASVTLVGRDGDGLGVAAAVGDFDGDGENDLIVTGEGATQPASPTGTAGAGVAYVITSPRLRQRGTIDLNDAATYMATPRIYGARGQDRLGASVAAARINNDQYIDLVLGAPGAVGDNGRIYVVFGFNPSGMTLVQTADPSAAGRKQSATLLGPTMNGSVGGALSTGDLDLDGKDDLAIGNYRGDSVLVVKGSKLVEDAIIDLGTAADVTVKSFGGDEFGYAVAIANLGGSRPELIAGSRRGNPVSGNIVYVVPLAPALDAGTTAIDLTMVRARISIIGPPYIDFGSAIAVGSLSDIGSHDLLIGAPGSAPAQSGAAYVVSDAQLRAAAKTPDHAMVMARTPAALTATGAPGDRLGGHVVVGNVDTLTATDEAVLGADNGGSGGQGIVYGVQSLR